MKKLPAFQFYPGDWLKDPRLSMCSATTRGIWIDFLCAMHELDRVGELRGTTEQLARVARCSPVEIAHALDELSASKTADINERNGVHTVVNRRMKREYEDRERNKDYVQKHREKQNVRNGKENVRNTQMTVNNEFEDENKNSKENVRLYSSSSSSSSLQNSGGGISNVAGARGNGKPPPAAFESPPMTETKTKAKEARLDALQAKYPQHDVRKVREKYLRWCKTTDGAEPKWEIFEEKWLKTEFETMEADEPKPLGNRRAEIEKCNLCDANGYIQIGDGARICKHEKETVKT